MTTTSAVAAATAASRARAPEAPDHATALFHAAQLLLPDLERGHRIDAARLRAAMEQAFGGSDSQGAWDWKSAYDACEAAAVLFLRKFGGAMAARAGSCDALLPMLAKVAGLLPTHTRRSEESETFQQFSTPLALGLAVGTAAAISPTDRVLEPSAGTGLLAIFAELAGASLMLNELAETRAGLLCRLFPDVDVTRFDAAQIDDHLDSGVTPTVVLMNPPFSALANVDRRRPGRCVPPRLVRAGAACRRRTPGRHHAGKPAHRIIPHGARTSCVCRSAALSCSRQPSTDRSTRDTAPRSRRASPSSTSVPLQTPGSFRYPLARPPMRRRCCGGSWSSSPRGCRSRPRWRKGPLVCPCAPPLAESNRGTRGSHPSRPPRLRPSVERSSSLRTTPSTGSRPREDASARRSTRTTPCSRSAFPARRRIRRGSCSRRQWPRSHRQSRPTGRTCRRVCCRKAFCRMRSWRASSTRGRRTPRISPAPGRWTRRSMWSAPRPS